MFEQKFKSLLIEDVFKALVLSLNSMNMSAPNKCLEPPQ